MPSPTSCAAPAPSRLVSLADLLDPPPAPPVDTFAVLGYEPNCRPRLDAIERGEDIAPCGECPQEQFHTAAEFDLLYGGAMGGGKTKALLMEGLRACVRYPGIAVMAVRESYPQLAESFLAELARIDVRALGAKYSKQTHDLTFANTSVLRFRYCDSLTDAELRLSSEIQLLLVDEATKQHPEAIQFLVVRLRSSNPAIPVLGVRLGTNPGGIGHGWAKKRYVVPTAHGTKVVDEVVDGQPTGHRIRFIPARYTDNPHLVDYEGSLNAVADPRLRKAYRDGSWDTFKGQVFVEWNHDRHVVRPFAVPPSWPRYAGIDWGFAAPWAVEWGALDPDGRLWIYRELYETGVGETEQARRILAAEGALDANAKVVAEPAERPKLRLADPSMWNTRGEVNPISTIYLAQGCVIHKATNDRTAGVQRVHSYLADGPACPAHRAAGWTTCPMVHVFDTCTELIRTLPDLPADKLDPEDVDTHAEDHGYDAIRYLALQLPVPFAERARAQTRDTSTMEGRVAAELDRLRRPRKRHHDELGSL